MKNDNELNEVFKRFLPSSTREEMEAARGRVLERVRVNVAAGREMGARTFALNRTDYHILLSLENGDRHAYAISSDVEALTEGATRFGPGTLFTSIQRLLTVGLIEETETRSDPRVNGEPRQYYRLTAAGQRALASESGRLAASSFHAEEQQVMRCL